MVTVCRTNFPVASLLLSLVMFSATVRSTMAEPIGWMERYALADDRESMLAELIPGSEDYYFYHCLYYQTTGQTERSEAILKDWLAEHKGRETATIKAMIDRQRLLTYNESPQRTIDHLVRRLGVKLDHSPPALKNERRFASKLDADAIDIDKIIVDALNRRDSLKPRGMQRLANRFRAGDTAGLSISLRDFLNRAGGGYLIGVDELVIKELAGRRPNEKRFGDLEAHSDMTLDELNRVAESVPEVADDNDLVAAVLRRLRPGEDSDLSQQPEIRTEYLKRVEAYLRSRPSSYNSMKASAAYRLLEDNLQNGVFDRDLFLHYLQLPRVSPIVRPEWLRGSGDRINLNDDFMEIARLPPIGNEEPVVRAHLDHFLRDAADTDAFADFLKPDYLRRVFAETKLLHGIGREEQWYRMLSASQRQEIRDAVQLSLSAENPSTFAADQPTSLQLDVKNIDELVVRIYEINTQSYYRTHDKQIDTDIDLDGLVATHEKKLTYHQPAVRRHRESVELPELSGRGVWIVDLVGKGLRARALIRRGAIDHVDLTTASGMVFTIIDENREPIPSAVMWVGAREFVADDQGRIALPPVVDDVSRNAIISDGSIATQIKFRHLTENYDLAAGMHLDRTQLQSGGKAELLIRPRLTMGGTVIDPATLGGVAVRIEATDLEKLSTIHEVTGLQLDQNGELVVPLRVPPRLAELKVTLSGTIDGMADGKERTLETSRQWDIAGIRRTSHTHDSFLTRDREEFVIEVRGRNGELIPHATVNLSLATNIRNAPVEKTLQSDQRGQIRLGTLAGVTGIRYSALGGLQHERDLRLDRVRWADEIHTTHDRSIQLPIAMEVKDVATRYRLVEVRDGGFHGEHQDKVSLGDGLITIGPLTAGDYLLIDRLTGTRTSVVSVEGPAIGAVAAGKIRHRAMSPSLPLGIASITQDDEGLKIKLSGNTRSARVHLYGSRYLERTSPIDQLNLPLPRLQGRPVWLAQSGYVSDLRLGDEYQYVLRRRYAKKFPGVMLPQPSVLLNPWETEETSNVSQSVRAGDVPPPAAMAPPGLEAADAMARSEAGSQVISSDYDFLADSGVVIANVRPDKEGVVRIARDAIVDLPVLQIVACDPATVVQRTVTAKLQPVETVDMRLSKSLGPEVPLTFERGVSVASPEQPLDLQSLGSAQLQVYASVADLLKLYKTLVSDSRLDDFDDLASWHSLDREGKLDAYSRLAGHELHLFVYFQDKPFFDDVVHPYLRNKKEKQFIDHWLLGDDLSSFTRLWQYNQLNAAEKALLAMRLPEARELVQRELRETVESQDENYAAVRKSVETALMNWGIAGAVGDRFDASGALGAVVQDAELAESEVMFELRALQRGQKKRKVAQQQVYGDFAVDADADGLMFGGRMGGGGYGRPFYRDLDSTKQWAESQWDRVRTVGGPAPASLINTNAFWSDLASVDETSVGVSANLLRPIENRHAALVALAMCGLPLASGEVGLPTEPGQLYRPAHAVAVVTKRLKRLSDAADESSILIGQRFEPLNPPGKRQKESASIEEPDEFLIGIAYQGQIVVSNPTAEQRIVDLFWQLPEGSIPLAGNQITDSRTIVLQPFAVQAIEYQFYFPEAGDFPHYPATVATADKLLARGSEKSFKAVTEASEQSTITWEKLAATGTAGEIEAFLSEANLREIDWIRVAHRMKDQPIYRVVSKVLGDAQLPINDLWAYAFVHRDDAGMETFLSLRDDLVSRVGPVLKSPLLMVEPVERRMHELLEYAPLVRGRVHRLGEHDEILNPTFRRQYESFARVLGYSSQIADREKLVLAYYLLIQNRIAKSIDVFQEIDRAKLDAQLQFDYLRAYLAMHREQYDEAERTARQYVDHPIPRWNHRFHQLVSQLKQRRDLNETEKLVSVEGQADTRPIPEGSGDLSVLDREIRQADAAQLQPEVIVRVEGDSLRIDHRRTKDVSIHFYGVDLELLFSKAPFVREDLQRMAMVHPSHSQQIEFDSATGVGRYDLDDNLRRQTLLVEVVAGASRSTALYYGGDITTYVSESFGQLQTIDANSNRPISTAYVKVYARYPDGSVRFYKDGYTDSRGRFDYVSVSAAEAQGAERFAILVMSDEKGATLHDVTAPQR